MKESTRQLVQGAFLNCGIATGVINGVISYLTMVKQNDLLLSELSMNFLLTAFGCGLLCPYFGRIILKAVNKNETISFGQKKDRLLGKLVPNNLILGALMISLLAVVILWGVPHLCIHFLQIDFSLSRGIWVICMGVYSALSASFGAYFGMQRVYYASCTSEKVLN